MFRNFKRGRGQLVTAGLLVIAAAYVVVCLLAPLPTLRAEKVPLTAQADAKPSRVTWSGYGEQAIGAVGYGLITSNGQNQPAPTASVAKVMAALAVLQKKPLQLNESGPSITITPADVEIYNADNTNNQSVIPVQSGEQLTEYQALEAMLVSSATNVATTLTNWAFGSQTAYTTFANGYARTLGMTQSNFADASGYSPQTVSTPSDLITLGEAAIQNPIIAQIVKKSSVDLPVAGTVRNFNIDIGMAGIDGIKTGNTDQAGGALLYSAKRSGIEIVGVTMNAPDLGTALHDAPEILNSFESSIKSKTVVKTGQTVAEYHLPWGGVTKAVAQDQLIVIEPQSTTIPVTATIKSLSAGDYSPSSVGTVSFDYHGKHYMTPVRLSQPIPQPPIWWRLAHP